MGDLGPRADVVLALGVPRGGGGAVAGGDVVGVVADLAGGVEGEAGRAGAAEGEGVAADVEVGEAAAVRVRVVPVGQFWVQTGRVSPKGEGGGSG